MLGQHILLIKPGDEQSYFNLILKEFDVFSCNDKSSLRH